MRRLILALSCCLSLTAYAMEWKNLWRTPDQQGKILYDAKAYGQAQQTFQRADWRALSAYRAQNFSQAAKDYLSLQTASGFYNAGNALAYSQQFSQALAAYDQALRLNPKDKDALFNREVVQKLLNEQQKKEQQNKEQSKNGNNSKDSASQSQNQNPSQQPSAAPEKPKQTSSKPKNQPSAKPQNKIAEKKSNAAKSTNEQQEANSQWLKLIPDDPGGLLRQKFLRDHLKRQNGSWS